MANPGSLSTILQKLPGKKILVRGNHDNNPISWYLSKGYSCVVDEFVLGPLKAINHCLGERIESINTDRILFSHFPQNTLQDTVSFCIHGHLHNNPLPPFYNQNINELFVLEQTYSPVELKAFLTVKERLL